VSLGPSLACINVEAVSRRWRALVESAPHAASLLNIAHRGARAFAPENTLEAIDLAAQLGADMVEIDVHLSRDEVPIVIHDANLIRCSDVTDRFPTRRPYLVSDLTVLEIQSLDAGSWYLQQLKREPAAREPHLRLLTSDEQRRFISAKALATYESGRVRHPTLAQCLARSRELSLLVNVEIKPGGNSAVVARKTIEVIRSMAAERTVIVSSFDEVCITAVRAWSETIATAMLMRGCGSETPGKLEHVDADAVHPGGEDDEHDAFGSRPLDKHQLEMIRGARSGGCGVNVWTVNDCDRTARLRAAGVTGIMTDYPNRLGHEEK